MKQKFGRLRLILFLVFFYLGCSLKNYAQLQPDILNNSVYSNASDTALGTDTTNRIKSIAAITVTGFKQTKSYIIDREIPFKRGDSIQRSDLPKLIELCRQQLMNTSLFIDVEVRVAAETNELVFIHINVKERWYIFPLPYFKMIDRNFNTWWVQHKRSLQRINYGLKFMHNNVSGRNDKLNIWLVNGYTKQVSLRYENPFLDKSLKHGMNVGFSYGSNHEIVYKTAFNKDTNILRLDNQFVIKQLHIDLAYSYRPAIKTRHNFRFSYSDIQVHDSVVKLNSSFFPGMSRRVRFPDLSYNIQYFNVDYIPYPLKGFSGEGTLYKRFGKENNLWQLDARGTYSFPVSPSSYLQFQAAGIIRFPYNQPYYALRMFGGDLYLRGLEYYVIDGVAGGMVRGTALQKVLDFTINNPVKIKNLEKVPFRVFLKTYSDLGYSYNPHPGNSILNNKLLKTWGVGIDIITFYDIVIKLEYSFNQLGKNDLFIHSKSDF